MRKHRIGDLWADTKRKLGWVYLQDGWHWVDDKGVSDKVDRGLRKKFGLVFMGNLIDQKTVRDERKARVQSILKKGEALGYIEVDNEGNVIENGLGLGHKIKVIKPKEEKLVKGLKDGKD